MVLFIYFFKNFFYFQKHNHNTQLYSKVLRFLTFRQEYRAKLKKNVLKLQRLITFSLIFGFQNFFFHRDQKKILYKTTVAEFLYFCFLTRLMPKKNTMDIVYFAQGEISAIHFFFLIWEGPILFSSKKYTRKMFVLVFYITSGLFLKSFKRF